MKKIILLLAVIFVITSYSQKKIKWVAIGNSITYLNDHKNETGNRITNDWWAGRKIGFVEAIKTIGKFEKLPVVDLYNEPRMRIEKLVKYKRLKDLQTNTYKNYPYPQYIDIPFNPSTDEYPYPVDAIEMTFDGLHPSNEGCKIIAEKLIDIIEKYN